MYEFLVTSAAGVKQKNRILFILGVALLCIILAVAMPLRTYAVATVVTTICAMVVGGLVGTGVATALSAAGVGIVVALLVGMGVSFTVSMLITAIQAQVDNGNWAAFCSDFVDQWEQRGTTFAALSVTAFYGAKEWVMNHIVKSADETITQDPTVTYPIYNCPVYETNSTYQYTVGTWMMENLELFGTIRFTQQEVANLVNDGDQVMKSLSGSYTNPDTNEVVNFEYYLSLQKHNAGNNYLLNRNYTVQNGGNKVEVGASTAIYPSGLGHWYDTDLKVYWPYYDSPKQCFRFDMIKYDGGRTEFGIGSSEYNDMGLSISGGSYYYLYANENGTSRQVIVNKNGTTINNGWRNGVEQFIGAIMFEPTTITLQGSNTAPVVTSPTYNSTTINNYYSAKNDVVSSVANTAHSAVQSGAITNEAAGAISIGIADSIAVGDVAADTVISDAAAIDSVDISSALTDVAPIGIYPALLIAGNNIKLGFGDLRYKFPFDVIPAVADWLQALVTPGEPLEIHYTFNVPFGAQTKVIHVDIDFAQYQTLVTVGNWVVLVSCAIGLLLASKKAFQFL